MSTPRTRCSIILLAMPKATASTLFGAYDLFCSVGRDWELLTSGRPGPGFYSVRVAASGGKGFRAANGVGVEPDCSLDEVDAADIVWVPELLVAPDENLAGQYQVELEFLQRCHARGALIAPACSGALLLAESGLLQGHEATCHWGYCDSMAQRHPEIRIQPERALVISGEGDRLVMAGGGTTFMDLALYLIARTHSVAEAMRMARLYLIDWHSGGQQPYALLARSRQVDDPIIARCQQWVAEHYDEPAPVAGMKEISGMSERTFMRRFSEATGYRPLEYVHTLRLEEAKQMLEATELPVEAVATEVGYEDASFFSRLFRRQVGLTPGAYRKRFGALHKLLRESSP